jgi:transposase-like protein
MAAPKWTEDRVTQLTDIVGAESPVSLATVADAAEQLETSTRSVASKLRKMGHDVELASAGNTKAFSDEEADTLAAFVTDNSGQYTYGEIAQYFQDGKFSAKQVQGKILSLELTGHVKATPPKEVTKAYSEAEEAQFLKLVANGATVEELAEALGREVNSIRGKALSLLRSGKIDAIPRQESSNAKTKEDPLAALGNVSDMTVEAIAEAIGKTARGVKTMLTRRGVTAADYDGAAKAAKAAATAE